MKLDNWAKIAEIMLAIVFVVSLIFLIVEVDQNTNSVRASTYQSMMGELNAWRLTMASDPTLSVAMQKVIDSPDELTDTERAKMILIFDAMWGLNENAFFTRKHGVLGDSEWVRFHRIMYENRDRFGWTINERLLTDEFRSYLKNC